MDYKMVCSRQRCILAQISLWDLNLKTMALKTKPSFFSCFFIYWHIIEFFKKSAIY
jgi:hypothetical protein